MGRHVLLRHLARQLPTKDYAGAPELTAMCVDGQTIVALVTSALLDMGPSQARKFGVARLPAVENLGVLLRFDDEPPIAQYWWRRNEYSLTSRGNAGIGLMRHMADAKRLRVQYPTVQYGKVVAEFELYGFKRHLPQLASACGWQP